MAINLPSGWTSSLTSNGGMISIPKNEETEDKTYRIMVKAIYDGKELSSKTCDVTLKGKSNDCDFSDLPEAIEITVNGTFPECNNATRTWSGTAYLDSDSLEMAQTECQEGDGNYIPSVIYHYDTAPGSGNYIEYNGDEFIGTFYVSKTTNGMFGISGSISGSLPCSGPVDGSDCNERSTSFGGEIADTTVSDLSGGLTLEAECGCAYCEDLTGDSGGGESGGGSGSCIKYSEFPSNKSINFLVKSNCDDEEENRTISMTKQSASASSIEYTGNIEYNGTLYSIELSYGHNSSIPACNVAGVVKDPNGTVVGNLYRSEEICCTDKNPSEGYYPSNIGTVTLTFTNAGCGDVA